MIKWITGLRIWMWLASAIVILLGLLKYSTYKNSNLEDEVKEIEDALKQKKYNHMIDIKNTINEGAYQKEKEKIHEVDSPIVKPYTT